MLAFSKKKIKQNDKRIVKMLVNEKVYILTSFFPIPLQQQVCFKTLEFTNSSSI